MKRNYFYLIKVIIIILYIGWVNIASSQDKTVKDLQAKVTKSTNKVKIDSGHVWKTGGLFNLNFGQGSQSNWAAGGDDFSLSIASYLGLYAHYKKNKYSWDNTLDFNYGLVKSTSLGTRKNDDRIDLLSKVGYELNPKLNVAGLFNFHSQFSKGYKYIGDSARDLLSNFLAPGYFLISVGLDFKPAKGLSVFVSPVSSRWTVVNNDSLSVKGSYGVSPGDKVKREIGAFLNLSYITKLSKTISYNGRLDLLSNYEHNPENVDVMMNSTFAAKINKVLTGSVGLNLIYDDDIKLFGPEHDSPGLQLKQIIALGLSVKI
ncbi:MAG: DUF3078 domain-containing protein [Ginsengibacter sp.]